MFIKRLLFLLFLPSVLMASETVVEMDALTPRDRHEYFQYLQQNVRSCTAGNSSLNQSCKNKSYGEGDPSFNEPYFNEIPKGYITKPNGAKVKQHVVVKTECDENEGKFYTTVMHRNKNGNWVSFQSPLGHPTNQKTRGGIERWLTSPGIYNYTGGAELDGAGNNGDFPLYRWRTKLPASKTGAAYMNEWHVVSSRKEREWKDNFNGEPPKMPWTLWSHVEKEIAYHCSNTVTGYPESHGCFRLHCENAQALFKLAQRVGTNNMTFKWGGYGRINPRTGQPFCAGVPNGTGGFLSDNLRVKQNEGTYGQIQTRSTNAKGNIFRRIGNWLRGLGNRSKGTRSSQ